jgi:PAS domain S-box-containing protein
LRKRAEEALRESRDYLERLTNSVWDVVFSVKMPERVIEWVNDSFRLIGYKPEESIGRTTEFLYRDKREFLDFGHKLEKALAKGKDMLHTEQLLQRKNGEVFPADITTTFYRERGEVIRTTSIVRDITERKQAEAEKRALEQKAYLASRLASLGEMASGIAHEINNPLTAILGYSQSLLRKDIPGDTKRKLEIIRDGTERVADIIGRLLAFSCQRKPEQSCVNHNEIVESTLALQAYALQTSNIRVARQLAPGLPCTMADASQMQQVFLNIIINAETEMKLAHGRGQLLIKSEVVDGTI